MLSFLPTSDYFQQQHSACFMTWQTLSLNSLQPDSGSQNCVLVNQLVNWCFEPSQPLRIILGPKETFIKRHIVERTNKAEKRPEEQSEKTEICWESLWNEIQLKGPQRQKKTQEQNKKEWASSVGLCHRHKLKHPHHMKGEPTGTQNGVQHCTCLYDSLHKCGRMAAVSASSPNTG